ncbi:MAG: NADH-dependent [FeFe] hydrogenase, group A6 [Anaerorhabdus sp.]
MVKVKVVINSIPVEIEEGMTIFDAAQEIGITIPTLCYLKGINKSGACRVCLVEIEGQRNLVTSCNYPVRDGLVVYTHSQRALEGRKNSVALLMSNHSKECLSCTRNQRCELQTLTSDLNVRRYDFNGSVTPISVDMLSHGIVRDTSKCILCGRCVNTCKKMQGLGILGYEGRGFNTKVGPAMGLSLRDVNCIQCGQCVTACPVAALTEKEAIHEVVSLINDPQKHVIVQTAPAVRAALGEEFGYPIGTRVTGKMVAALRQAGFSKVYDTNFGADLTIMEEGTEFIHRIQEDGALPMITSCSPGWVRYIEFEYPELLDHLSSCKSPHMMLGAALKSHYAKQKGIKTRDIYVVSIMPCTAKKSEIEREENKVNGIKDVDIVLTTKECARMIKMLGIDFNSLADQEFDQDMFGEYSGAGVIFGTGGGVMEAALRTVKELIEHKPLDKIEFEEVRSLDGIKEASIEINGKEVFVAVASGMIHAKKLLEQIKDGTTKYQFIEIMGCPGGCINGGGQPQISSVLKNAKGAPDFRKLRAKALYDEDSNCLVRKSHENKQIQELYSSFFGEPGSHLAHELLHTTYSKKKRFGVFKE